MSDVEPKQQDLSPKNWLCLAVYVCAGVVVAFALLSVVQYQLVKSGQWRPVQEHGLSGDMFGMANAIASALAFALFIVTLRMQAAELREQREQFTKMATAQTASDEKMLLQTYLNALSLESANDVENDKPSETSSFTSRLNKMALKIRFGRRAAWVRQCVEADLCKRPRPEPPNFDLANEAESQFKYWRMIAKHMDEVNRGNRDDSAALEFCKKISPFFQSDYWGSLPDSPAKQSFRQLIDVVQSAALADSASAWGNRLGFKVEEALTKVQSRFTAVVKTLCFPTKLEEVE